VPPVYMLRQRGPSRCRTILVRRSQRSFPSFPSRFLLHFASPLEDRHQPLQLLSKPCTRPFLVVPAVKRSPCVAPSSVSAKLVRVLMSSSALLPSSSGVGGTSHSRSTQFTRTERVNRSKWVKFRGYRRSGENRVRCLPATYRTRFSPKRV
jgi:hypothetical protein